MSGEEKPDSKRYALSVIEALQQHISMTTEDLLEIVPMPRDKLCTMLDKICESGKIRKVGSYTSFNLQTGQSTNGYVYRLSTLREPNEKNLLKREIPETRRKWQEKVQAARRGGLLGADRASTW